MSNTRKYLHSDNLDIAIQEVKVVREPLIEGFMFKHSAHMIYAPDGHGKSVINLQKAMQATVDGAKVFGEFNVDKGLRVLYLQMERHEDEVLERLKAMTSRTQFNSKNFVLSTALQGLNLKDKDDFKQAVSIVNEIIEDTLKEVDLIELDPIYAMVDTDLVSNKDVAPITNFSRILQQRYNCSINFIHHSNRGVRDPETGKRGNEDFFGSRFLSAHFTGVYRLELNKDEGGCVLTAEKSSHKNLEKRIELMFDPESYLSWFKKSGSLTKNDKLMAFLRTCELAEKPFDIDEAVASSGLTVGATRNVFSASLKNHLLVVGKAKYGKNLYKFKT